MPYDKIIKYIGSRENTSATATATATVAATFSAIVAVATNDYFTTAAAATFTTYIAVSAMMI